jgi:hypothetical protein
MSDAAIRFYLSKKEANPGEKRSPSHDLTSTTLQRKLAHRCINIYENTLHRSIAARSHSFRRDLLFGFAVGPRLSINARPSLQPVLVGLLDTIDQRLPVGRIPVPQPQ